MGRSYEEWRTVMIKRTLDLPYRFECNPGDRIPDEIVDRGHWFPQRSEDGDAIAVLCFGTEEELDRVMQEILKRRVQHDVKNLINGEGAEV